MNNHGASACTTPCGEDVRQERCGVPMVGGTDSGYCKTCGQLSATLVHGHCLQHIPADTGINLCKPESCPPGK